MARQQGNEMGGADAEDRAEERPAGRHAPSSAPGGATPEGSAATGLPEPFRKLIALGLSGMFATQESLRQAVGDALPKEWVDFALDQSERTRTDFLERLAGELARSFETIDLARVMQQALEGRTLEVSARIRMLPDDGEPGVRLKLSMKEDEEG